MSRRVWELQHPNLLDATGRIQRSGQLSETEVPAGPEIGDGQEAREVGQQRGQQGSHCARFPQHRPLRARLLGGVAELLRQEPEPRVPGHRRSRVSEGGQKHARVGEEELQEAVPRVRPRGDREAHQGGQQLQMQIPLVLHGEVREVHAGRVEILLYRQTREEVEQQIKAQASAASQQLKNIFLFFFRTFV